MAFSKIDGFDVIPRMPSSSTRRLSSARFMPQTGFKKSCLLGKFVLRESIEPHTLVVFDEPS